MDRLPSPAGETPRRRPAAAETPLQTWTRSLLALVDDARDHLGKREFHAFCETGFFRLSRELVDAELDDWRRAG
jgi:hypothetical protein